MMTKVTKNELIQLINELYYRYNDADIWYDIPHDGRIIIQLNEKQKNIKTLEEF